MPCPGLEGTSYIVSAVSEHFEGYWPLALWEFVMDPKQRWCPTWIVRNYEVHNKVIHGLPQLSARPAPRPTDSTADPDEAAIERFPHANAYRVKFKFGRSGEPNADEPADPDDPAENLADDDRWTEANRTGWQIHSSLGPNVRPEGRLLHVSPLEATVNPPDIDYGVNEFGVRINAVRRVWDSLQEAFHQYCDESLHRATLGDDYQQLFVEIVMIHVHELTQLILKRETPP